MKMKENLIRVEKGQNQVFLNEFVLSSLRSRQEGVSGEEIKETQR